MRWGRGPFGVLDAMRKLFLGVEIYQYESGDIHLSTRRHLTARKLLECPRCTLFWVGLALAPVVWYAPALVIIFGIMGAASLLDNFA